MEVKTRMPAELAEAHKLIGRELSLLYAKWHDFKALYCTDDERVGLVHRTAEFVFRLHAELLRDDLILSSAG